MASTKCQHCRGCGKITTCDSCGKDISGAWYSCAWCDAELCDTCYTVNKHAQVICKKHDPDTLVERGGRYVNSPQWDGL
jgi:RecJ-like exonuclease